MRIRHKDTEDTKDKQLAIIILQWGLHLPAFAAGLKRAHILIITKDTWFKNIFRFERAIFFAALTYLHTYKNMKSYYH